MIDVSNKTARQHCRDRHTACSWEQHRPDSTRWLKICGYVVVADAQNNVRNGMIYAIEVHNNTPELHHYTRKNLTGLAAEKTYSVRSLQRLLKSSELWESNATTYSDIMETVKDTLPDAIIPTQSRLCIEFGIKYDRYTDAMINLFGFKND